MELKFIKRFTADDWKPVLIAPLWNWNFTGTKTELTVGTCSNRTFMELKWYSDMRRHWRQARSNRTFMELKCHYAFAQKWNGIVLIAPLWNWNDGYEGMAFCRWTGSNRTFMELKLHKTVAMEAVMPVLIAPLWNWNLLSEFVLS